jgi:predicted nucleic acid-binding protein
LDTSVIINYANVNRLHLLLRVIDEIVFVPDVTREVTREHQRIALESMMLESQCSFIDDDALSSEAITLASRTGLGKGECFAYRHALHNDCWLATDDRRAIRIFARIGENVTIITSVDILKLLLQEKVIDDVEAVEIVADWSSTYRFRVSWPL